MAVELVEIQGGPFLWVQPETVDDLRRAYELAAAVCADDKTRISTTPIAWSDSGIAGVLIAIKSR